MMEIRKAGELAILMFALGNLQAWDSNVLEAGLSIVLLVSPAMDLPPVALLVSIPGR